MWKIAAMILIAVAPLVPAVVKKVKKAKERQSPSTDQLLEELAARVYADQQAEKRGKAESKIRLALEKSIGIDE